MTGDWGKALKEVDGWLLRVFEKLKLLGFPVKISCDKSPSAIWVNIVNKKEASNSIELPASFL